MHMMLMLGIVSVFYFFSLTFICLYRDKINIKIGNLIFVIADLFFFFCWNLAAYQRGWLDKRFMTLDNISPMVCTAIPFIYLLNDKMKHACLCMVAFFSFGMFCAMYISPERAYLFSFDEEASFLYASEALCHMCCSLFGIYLVLTHQVKADIKDWARALVFTFSIIGFGVALNFIFRKNFFGMDPYGNYAIYGIDIFGSFWATLLAYCTGVLIVLTLGLHICALLEWFSKKKIKPHVQETQVQVHEQAQDVQELSQVGV